jgi:hypothetical protein
MAARQNHLTSGVADWVDARAGRGSHGSRRQGRAQTPPPKLFPEDARLSRKVTVARGRVYLGELLQDLSRQARVPLTVEDTKGP